MDPEDIDSALERFEELLMAPQLDMPAFLIIEGGTWQERVVIAQQFGEIIPEHLGIVELDLRQEFADDTIGDDYGSLDLVQSRISQHIRREATSGRQSVVFLWWYDLLLPLDDRLRSYFRENHQVRCWVLLPERKWLSETSPSQRGGQFRGYLRDEALGAVIIAQPRGAYARRHRNRRPQKQPANVGMTHTPGSHSEQRFGPTRAQIEAALRAREGQAKFREDLLRAFSYRCAVTGCMVSELLEAAHIQPYSEDQDHRLSNGLILRADIHTLYDKGLLAINPVEACRGQIVLHQNLQRDPQYGAFHLTFVVLPASECVARQAALQHQYHRFCTSGV